MRRAVPNSPPVTARIERLTRSDVSDMPSDPPMNPNARPRITICGVNPWLSVATTSSTPISATATASPIAAPMAALRYPRFSSARVVSTHSSPVTARTSRRRATRPSAMSAGVSAKPTTTSAITTSTGTPSATPAITTSAAPRTCDAVSSTNARRMRRRESASDHRV